MKRFYLLATLFTAALLSCSKDPIDDGNEQKPERDSVLVYSISMPKYVFGFTGQNRYSYCPSIVDNGDGTTHVYFCGTKSNIFVDNIYHMIKMNYEIVDGVLHFFVTYNPIVKRVADPLEKMEKLTISGGIENG